MRRLDRAGCVPPADWQAVVKKGLKAAAAFFQAEAAAFEALPLNDPQRRGGFTGRAVKGLPRKQGRAFFPTTWGKAKDAIEKVSHRKCAYCETPINAQRSGQVEHFKPKALFPTLAYVWDNYFLACGGCNGPKSDKWPKAGTYVRPDQGAPEGRFTFTQDGKVKAAPGDADASSTVRDFDMNQKWLVGLRRKTISKELELLQDLVEASHGGDEVRAAMIWVARQEWKRLEQDPELPYTVAMRQCFRRAWKQAFPGEPL
jgi:uncharacterized protein (TIGR02646 family)